MSKAKVQVEDLVQWMDEHSGVRVFGRVRKVLTLSVIVDVIGTDYSTVVNFKRLTVVKEEDVDESAGTRFLQAHRAMGSRKRIQVQVY